MPNHAVPLELRTPSPALPRKVDKEEVTMRTVDHLVEVGRGGEEVEDKEDNNLEPLQWVHSLTLPLPLSRPVSCTLLLQSGTLPLSNTTLTSTSNLTSKPKTQLFLSLSLYNDLSTFFLKLSPSLGSPPFLFLFASHCSVFIPF